MDVHEVWGFSEDFAMSGLRCGVLTSKNDDLLAAVGELAYRSVVSGDTQHLLAGEAWVTTYLVELRARLKHSYEVTTTALEAAGLSYIDGDAGLVLRLDVRPFR